MQALAAAIVAFTMLYLKRLYTIDATAVYRKALIALNTNPGVLEVNDNAAVLVTEVVYITMIVRTCCNSPFSHCILHTVVCIATFAWYRLQCCLCLHGQVDPLWMCEDTQV